MEIILKSRTRRVKKPVERDFTWYDSRSKQMLHGRGGELRYEYSREQRRSVPVLIDSEDWVLENDYGDITKWVDQNKESVEIINHAKNHYILIDVTPSSYDVLTDDLIRKGIMFE